jgi:hypothetical protein
LNRDMRAKGKLRTIAGVPRADAPVAVVLAGFCRPPG